MAESSGVFSTAFLRPCPWLIDAKALMASGSQLRLPSPSVLPLLPLRWQNQHVAVALQNVLAYYLADRMAWHYNSHVQTGETKTGTGPVSASSARGAATAEVES